MTFDNIYYLLLWYFRKAWLNPPKMPGNHIMKDIRWKKAAASIEEVFEAATKMREIVGTLPPRDRELIKLLFTEKTTDEVANERSLTARRIRQIRGQIIETLAIRCRRVGLLGTSGTVFEPVMVVNPAGSL